MSDHGTALSTTRPILALADSLTALVRGRLWLKVFIGMILGLVTGVLCGPGIGLVPVTVSEPLGNWLAFPGQLFLALIQMIVIPLVFASIVRGLAAGENFEQLRQMGVRVVLFFVATTIVATIIGIALAQLIKPGLALDSHLLQQATQHVAASPSNGDIPSIPTLAEIPKQLLILLPGNPLSSMVESQMLQIVVFAIIIGIALVSMTPSRAKPLLELMGSLQEVCMTIVRWAMLLAPFAVFGLLAQLTMKIGFDALFGMTVYVLTVLLGLFIMFAFYLAIFKFADGMSLRYFLASIRELLLLAFSTSSSAAVMPLSIKTAEEKLGVRPAVAQFVIPLGATINMNGTALYQGVAAVFLAQAYGIDLNLANMALIVVVAVGASIGSPATPGVGMIILSMVLTTVGIPASGIALLLGVDRILDMSRTAINVTGDLLVARLVDRMVPASIGMASANETV